MAAHPLVDRAKKTFLRTSLGVGAAGLVLAGLALPATALETIDPASVQAPTGDACPELTAVKYPWITCREGEYGGVTLALPSEPPPLVCNLRLLNGECAASPRAWGIGPMFPPSGD